MSKINNLLQNWLPILIPIIILVVHIQLFWNWQIDDAGISFAYARHLAEGHGLVAQPGQVPVEGYSNLLWVILLVPFFLIDLFDPDLTAKLISVVLVIASFGIFWKSVLRLGENPIIAFSVLALAAMNPSFAIWTTGGLENPLYVLLIVLLFDLIVQYLFQAKTTTRQAIWVGLAALAVAMTRPDGIAYLFLFPLIVWIFHRNQWIRGDAIRQQMLRYAIMCIAVYGLLTIFRLIYFESVLPNIYYAKSGPGLLRPLQVLTLQFPLEIKLTLLARDAIGPVSNLIVLSMVVMTTWLLATRQLGPKLALIGMFVAWTLGVFMVLPEDWMLENRFATPFFIFFYLYMVVIARVFLNRLPQANANRLNFFLFSLLVAINGIFAYARSNAYADEPNISLKSVENFSQGFDAYASDLGLQDASILSPDIGGLLYYGDLYVYDLAGLTDKTIARTLDKDQAAFYDYVFEEARPTFVHLHDNWSHLAKMDADSRFREAYIPICEYGEAPRFVDDDAVMSGVYIRKDAVSEANEDALHTIQEAYSCGGG